MAAPDDEPRPLPLDYDRNPDRFRTGRAVTNEFGLCGDVHAPVAQRLIAEAAKPILDIGCGDGALARLLSSSGPVKCVGVDLSRTLVRYAPPPVVLGDAAHLPFQSASFGAAVALYMLYHLADPLLAIAEARRVLRVGGLFVAAAPSRRDSPELNVLLSKEPMATFDAESGPALIAEVFGNVDVRTWDGPYLQLPDARALRRYLMGRSRTLSEAESAISRFTYPLALTKRGAVIFSRKL
jgi:SAM-dependent methyltransferase